MASRILARSFIIILILTAPALFAASPGNGDLGSGKEELAWSGSPLAPNPAACATALDPACDHFKLTISSKAIKRVMVAIAPAAGFEADDYDLYVYDPNGVLIAKDATSDGYETVVIENTGAAYYEVRVQPWLINPGSSYNGVAFRTRENATDGAENDCLEAVPENIGLPGITDAGQRVELSVMLFLDGTDATVAQQQMAKAAASYAEWGIDLKLVKTQAISISTSISDEIIAAAKAAVGGVPPRGVDLVGVYTTKTMQSIAGGATVVGQADCIGGVRWDKHSFFVVSDIRNIENPTTGNTGTIASLGLNLNVDANAETFAHEIGHLMGAQHHYANCVEGNLTSAGPNDASPCTLMFNAVNGTSLNFGALSGAVVRGHAVQHASP